MVRQFAAIRDSETMSLVREICCAAAGGEPVDLDSLLLSCSNSISPHRLRLLSPQNQAEGCGLHLYRPDDICYKGYDQIMSYIVTFHTIAKRRK